MWNKLSQVAGLTTSEEDNEEKEVSSGSEDKEQLQQQEILIQHLKDLVRENEKRFQDKTKEYDKLESNFKKFKLKSKATISHLSSQVKGKEQTGKKEECDFDDASSTDSSDQSQRGKVILLKKQLDQAKQQLAKKEEECKKISEEFKKKVNDLELQLNEKNILISTFADAENEKTKATVDSSPKKETSSQEMYAQIVYKDSKILDLNNQILELEKQIMDLQEHVKEKDEVLQQRNRAVQLMAEDMSRKGKSVVDELDETREQMKIMQTNFSTTESDWKVQIEKYTSRIAELENEMVEWDKKLKSSEATAKSLEAARYELSIKNADLQKKIVSVQESAAKQCEQYNKEIGGEVEVLKKNLESEKQRTSELQKALDESSSQSDNKVLKARVKERTKSKALERELNELKKIQENKPQEVLELQQKIAELEEEKGSLQLKLIDIEDQVTQLDKLKKENEELSKYVEKGLNKIKTLEQQISELHIDRENWETKFETLEESYSELKEQFSSSLKDKSELEENYAALLQSTERIGSELKMFKEEYNILQKNYKEICQDFEEIKDQKISFELKAIELEEIRESDEKTKKELITKIEELNKPLNIEDKPEIQLEKENLELKDKICELADKNNELLTKCNNLSLEADTLQASLTKEQTKNSAEIESLISKISATEQSYKEVLQDLHLKTVECDNKNLSIQDLESNLSLLQEELSELFSHVKAKDINDCKNHILQKNQEYSYLKADFKKLFEEKNNLLLNFQENSDKVQKYDSKLEKLESLLDQRDKEIESLESILENIKENLLKKDNVIENHVQELSSMKATVVQLEDTIAGKDNYISELFSELEKSKSAEKSFMETLNEKLELIVKYEACQESLKQELISLQNSRLADQEKYKSNSESLLGQITDLESELASLRDEMSSKEKLVEDLNISIVQLQTDYDCVLNKLEKEKINAQQKEIIIDSFESSVKSKDDSIFSLNSEMDSFKQAVEHKNLEISNLMQKLNKLEDVLQAKDNDLSKMGSEMEGAVKLLNEKQQELKLVKEKNVLLEEEKLHSTLSLTEKDEVHNQIVKNKLQLEEDICYLQYENSKLVDELHLIGETISEMSGLIQNRVKFNIESFLKKLYSSNNKMTTLAEQFFHELEDYENVMAKNSNQVLEMQASLVKLTTELKESSSAASNWKTQCEELSNKVDLMEGNLRQLEDMRNDLESQKVKLQEELQSLEKENILEKNKFASFQQENLSKIANLEKEIQKYQTELKKILDNYKLLQEEHSNLAEKHNLIKVSLNDYEEKERCQTDSVQLSEKNASLEIKLLELKQLVDDYKNQLQSSQDKVNQNNDKFAKEKAELESFIQNLKAENDNTHSCIAELKTKNEQFKNENELNVTATSALQTLVAEKELQISGLNLHLSVLEEKLSDLNSVLTQKEIEQTNYKDSIDLELKLLRNYKENYYSVAKALKNSNQIVADISFLESNCIQTESVDEVAKLSKMVAESIVAYFFEIQDITRNNVSDLGKFQEEKQNLVLQNDRLRNFLIDLTNTFQENLRNTDIKHEMIFSALNEKINALEKTKSRVSILSKSFCQEKERASSLQSDLNCKLNELLITKESLCKSEEAVGNLTAEKTELEKTLGSLNATNSDLVTSLQEAEDNYNSLKATAEQQQRNLENYILENGELRNLVNNKDIEISKLIREYDNAQGTVITFQKELANAQSSISVLQNEVRQLNQQLRDYTYSHVLETSNNVSNGLQVEVESLRSELASSLEEKNSLQQHIENTNLQLQLLMDEKSALESCIDEMQHKLNEVIETNFNLSNSLEESSMLMASNEKRIHDLEMQHSKSIAKFESTCTEVESFKQEKIDLQSKEKVLLEKIELLEKRHESVINALSRINSLVSESEDQNSDFDFGVFTDNEDDQCLLRNLKDFTVMLTETRKDRNDLQNYIKSLELKNTELVEALEETREMLCDYQNKSTSKDSDKTQKISVALPPEESIVFDKNLKQQSSFSSPDESFAKLEKENETLKKEVTEYKIKFAKSLNKLKLFKDKNEKLGAELIELKYKRDELESVCLKAMDSGKELQSLLTSLKKENGELLVQLQLCSEEKQNELTKFKDIIVQLKERISLLEEESCKTKEELYDYKQSWEQLNVSYELQKEDNDKLGVKLKTVMEQAEMSKVKLYELNCDLVQFKNDNQHLRQEVENSREHANMLLSDNDTYQNLIEKLTTSKNSLEQKLSELKGKFNAELKSLKDKHEQELKSLGDKSNQAIDVVSYTKMEEECISLKKFCSEMEHSIKILQQERDSCLRSQGLLEKEKLYLQHQLCEKVEELQTTKLKLDELVKSGAHVASSSAEIYQTMPDSTVSMLANSTNKDLQYDLLKEENGSLKSEIYSLTQVLNQAKEDLNVLQQNYFAKDKHNKDLIMELEGKSGLSTNEPCIQTGPSNNEYELQQAMTSLHKQGLRCEELSLEVSKLLEERNVLRWKLQQCGPENKVESDVNSVDAAFSDLVSVKVESPTSNMDVATLHARLAESEKTCQQLRHANDALDRALSNERDQKRMVEEELGYAKDHLAGDAKASDEYQILLGEIEEPECFPENNFSITRNVQTHAFKLRRWLRGRRNYLWRTVKSRNYRQLVYIFYIFFIHVWLIACVSL